MILARRQAAPLRFLIGVMIAWVAVRGAVLSGWHPDTAPPHWAAGPAPGPLLAAMPQPIAIPAATPTHPTRIARTAVAPRRPTPPHGALEGPPRAIAPMAGDAMALLAAARPHPPPEAAPPEPTPAIAALATPRPAATAGASRFSGSAWLYAREGSGGGALSPDGQLGGSQMGARLLYRLADGVSASARVSHALAGPPQSEAAVGIDWQPVRSVPVHVMVDRRVALDDGGRNAWSAGIAGGAYDVPVADKVRLDGYAQAGVVGARSRDLYVDGAVRVGREVALGDDRSVTIGAGAWGAAQPGVDRVDLGPSAVLRVPLDHATLAVALDGRLRVAGDARPGSGVALTVGVDF